MSTSTYPRVLWPDGLDEYAITEMNAKGYATLRIAVAKELVYSLYFTDPVRLNQDVEAEIKQGGYPCFDQPGMVIIPEVTPENVEKAVRYLCKTPFFSHLQPDSDSAGAASVEVDI